MRTILKHGLCAAAAMALFACGRPTPQEANNPLAGRPTPQAPITSHSPQRANDPFAGSDNRHSAQSSTIGSHGPQQPGLTTPGPQQAASDPSPQTSIWGEPKSGENQPAPKEPLTENEILAVAAAANNGEIQMGELGRQKAQSSEVKQFAAMMVQHHRESMNKGKKLLGEERQLEDNRVSKEIRDHSNQSMATLRNESGKEFDRNFMNAQVRSHQKVLEVIDNRLMPNAEDPKVKSHLSSMRKNVAMHLAKAEDIQKKLDPETAKTVQDKGTTGNRGQSEKGKAGDKKKDDKKKKDDTR
jgi:putative membrane protein